MSKQAESLVWKRARAKGSNLLVLIKIADLADDDGRNAFAGAAHLARYARLTDRALRYILHKLQREGEIVIEFNVQREFITIGRKKFLPEWFIHVRCVYDWEAYEAESDSANFSDEPFQTGRRKRQKEPEKFAESGQERTGKVCTVIGSRLPGNRKNHVPHIRKDLLVDPLDKQEQGAAPPIAAQKPKRTDDDDPNFGVVLKTAHEAIDLDGVDASLSQLAATTKSLCRIRRLTFGNHSDLVNRAIDAAVWQRTHRGGQDARA